MSINNPYESSRTPGETPIPNAGKWKISLVQVLMVVGVMGILAVMFLPFPRVAREAARRGQCGNNLKQIAMALQSYETVYHALPPAYTVDAKGKPLHSWRTLVLPYLEQESLYKKVDLSKPWDDLANKEVRETILPVYHCPSADGPDGLTTYLAVVTPGGCFRPTEPRKLAEITEKTGLTLMVVDVDAKQAVPWLSPNDADEQTIVNLGTAARLSHPKGFLAAFVDGHVQFLSSNTNAETLRALISIAGNDDDVAQDANK